MERYLLAKDLVMVLENFFKLDGTPVKYEGDALKIALRETEIKDCAIWEPIELNPETVEQTKVRNKQFQNVSFKNKRFSRLIFSECSFHGCIFIGAAFDRCEFHNCKFVRCNFYKAEFTRVYGKPKQFRFAIPEKGFANVAVGFYRALLDNYSNESQRRARVETDYYFRKWERISEAEEFLKRKTRVGKREYIMWLGQHALSWIQDFFFGYGSKVHRMLATIMGTIAALAFLNLLCASQMYDPKPASFGFWDSVYCTFTTMTTLGAAGFSPITTTGHLVVMLDVLCGITLLSSVLSATFKHILP